MELSESTIATFMEFGERFNLLAQQEIYEDGAICVFYDRQAGLDEDIWMCFNNIDEISYSAGKFFGGSAFPCPDALNDFTESINGILSGRHQIRYGWFGSVLEEKVGETWKIRGRYSSPHWNGFRFRTFANKPLEGSY
ncbi:hypothetical protein [Palleronia sp. THAF1]|uniref:hypothetical protein n=1 Tax=Palleronia sp. THAF1 TaxID=2587842 RepID=UPI000F5310A8|nr:hypothetical protein [Palleronia sp. THAF1]